jgi:hypothetical protein
MAQPELPPEEGFVPEREVMRSLTREKKMVPGGEPQRKKEATDEGVPAAGEMEVILAVSDAAAAADAIEKAVTRLGGKISFRANGDESHFLSTQIEGRRLPELFARLGRIGKMQEQPQLPEGRSGAITLVIRW